MGTTTEIETEAETEIAQTTTTTTTILSTTTTTASTTTKARSTTEAPTEKTIVKKKFGSRSKSRINRIRQSLRGSSEVPSGTGIVELLNSRISQRRERPEFIPSSAEGPKSSRESNDGPVDPVIDDKKAAKLLDRRKNLFKSRNRVRIQRPQSGSKVRARPSIIDIEETPRSVGLPAANTANQADRNNRFSRLRRPVTPQSKNLLPTTAAAKASISSSNNNNKARNLSSEVSSSKQETAAIGDQRSVRCRFFGRDCDANHSSSEYTFTKYVVKSNILNLLNQ